jgi:hypothetical protein
MPQNLNWGVIVLACPYRNLSTPSLSQNKIIGGALLLLMHWSLTRFLIARPRHTGHAVQFVGLSMEHFGRLLDPYHI